MKNLTATLLISIAIISCKKETATITKVDEKTGKTITVEVPADSVKTVEASPAIADSTGIFRQGFKLEKGQTYPFITLQKNTQTITDPSGKTVNMTTETSDEMSFTVVGETNGVYDIDINIISKKNQQSAEGKTVAIDTKSNAPQDPQLKLMWKVNKALVGNKLKLKLKKDGAVQSITGFDAIYKKAGDALSADLKTAEQKKAFIDGFKESFDEKTLKTQLEKNLKIFPAKGVKVGEKWSESENATPDGKIKLTTTYQLKSIGNGVAEIGVTGGIPKQSDKQSQQGMTHSMSSELTQNGTIKLDQNTGWILSQNINVKTVQTESMSDGKQTQTMKSTTNSNVMVNTK
ncbi:MAG: DUF6263 family protein [Bergeyella sp.]